MSNTSQSGEPRSVRVVIVDDHTIFRSGLKADLDHRMDVVGEAGTVEGKRGAACCSAPACSVTRSEGCPEEVRATVCGATEGATCAAGVGRLVP